MGISNDNKKSYRRHPIQTRLWHKSSYPSGSLSSLRREPFDGKTNDGSHRLDLDCLYHVRENALQGMTKYHNQRVKLRRFNPKYLVL